MDDTFELLTKMYADITKRFDAIEAGQNELRSDVNELKSSQKKIEVTLEHDIKLSLQVLHERAAVNSEKLDEHSRRLDVVENKLDYLALSVNSQDKRLEVVEGSKKKKAR